MDATITITDRSKGENFMVGKSKRNSIESLGRN
jgi:hypothetical protein